LTEKAEHPYFQDAQLAFLALLRNDLGTALHHLGALDQAALVKVAAAGTLLANLSLREATDGPARPPAAWSEDFMAFSKGFALKTQQKSGKTAQNKASGSRKQAAGQPGTASWRDFMPGRITLQDALEDPDPLFPLE
jgi:hypothetical protein